MKVMRGPAELTPKGKIVAGLFGTFAVCLCAIDRASVVTASISNAPIILCSSFIRGLSKSSAPNASLDAATLFRAENSAAQSSSLLEKMRKDFNEAYDFQKELFTKASSTMTNTDIDKAESFLLLPQKEFLALDRTARTTFLTRFGDPNQARQMLDHLDAIGHGYSAAVSVLLINTCNLGESLGELTVTKLRYLPQPIRVAIQLYFISHFLNNEVINSPLGKGLFSPELANLVMNSSLGKTLALPELAKAFGTMPNTTNAGTSALPENPLGNTLDAVRQVNASMPTDAAKTNGSTIGNAIGTVLNILDAARQVNAFIPIDAANTVGSTIGGAIGTVVSGGSAQGSMIGAVGGIVVVKALLAAKTYVVAPALAGLCDGLMEPVHIKTIQAVVKTADTVTTEDRNYLVRLFTSAGKDLNTAHNAALKKFTKYDKILEGTAKEIEQAPESRPMAEILKQKPHKAKKTNVLLGREILLKSGGKKTQQEASSTDEDKDAKQDKSKAQQAVNLIDKAKAVAQAGASFVAATSYRLGKAAPGFLIKAVKRGEAKNKRWSNRKI